MKKFSANYILLPGKRILKNGIIITDDDGRIIEVIDTKGQLREIASLEFHNGVIVPGFVNCHCHTELSSLKGMIEPRSKLTGFIKQIRELRTKNSLSAVDIERIDKQMWQSGIVAVGDICNTSLSFGIKQKSPIYYHNFIEIYGLHNGEAQRVFDKAVELRKSAVEEYDIAEKKISIVPHAWYSVSDKLMELIHANAKSVNEILTIHNQETDSENQLFSDSSGPLYDLLKNIGNDFSSVNSHGETSLQARINDLPNGLNLLLVHNVFSTKDDVAYTVQNFSNLFWVLCPKSNFYIEGRLPDIELMIQNGAVLTLGTDSLASNDFTSIFDEIKVISEHFPNIDFFDIINWATINGAKALRINDEFGSIEAGKKPGLNLIRRFDFGDMRIKPSSYVQKLI